MTRGTFTQHLLFRAEMKLEAIKTRFDAAELSGDSIEETYQDMCQKANILPLGKEPCASLLEDRRSCMAFEPEDVVECLKVVTKELKDNGRANLQEIYSNHDLPDIPLYQAFEILIAHGVADGVSPYDLDEIGQVIHPNHTTMEIVAGEELDKLKSVCIANIKDGFPSVDDHLNPQWDRPRKAAIVLLSNESDPEKAASTVFEKLNNPACFEQRYVLGYKGPSFSVGDVAEIYDINGKTEPTQALCAPVGWKTRPLNKTEPTMKPTAGEPTQKEQDGAAIKAIDAARELRTPTKKAPEKPKAKAKPGFGPEMN